MIYQRRLPLWSILKSKSILLLGPRQTGKSYLVTHLFPNAHYTNLAQSDTFRELSAHPELLRQRLPEQQKLLIIDEAQRVPELFDEVQVLLDRNKSLRVVLTGSSARKLRRGGLNLLPGRLWRRELFPLVSAELEKPRIAERVVRGSLPGILDRADFREELKNYVGLYLEEEIRAEGLTRQIGHFSRFLQVAATTNAQQVNFTKIADDLGVAPNTIRGYYQILEDTLVGHQLPVFKGTFKRKPVAIAKFYMFDGGVVNALLNRFEISAGNELFGPALEHLIFLELKAYLSYSGKDLELTYWRSRSKLEVDFLLGDQIAIEVKAARHVNARDEKGLVALSEEVRLKRKIIVCTEAVPRKSDSGVEIRPVEHFLAELWSGQIV